MAMSAEDTLQRYLKMLRDNPEIAFGLNEAVNFEEDPKNATTMSIGWPWYITHLSPATLNHLVSEWLVDIVYSSHSSTGYKLHDRNITKRLLAEFQVSDSKLQVQQDTKLPEDLFTPIVGLEDVKDLLLKSLKSKKPVHVLLVGPRSSAKSLFLSEIARLPNSRFALGASTSKAGLEDFILQFRPAYLLLDELDKMNRKDFSVLYSLLEFGFVTRMKKGMTEQENINIRVYAACNTLIGIPIEIVSRFATKDLPEYTKDEFEEVVIGFLTKREGTPYDLAVYIAQKLSGRTRDPRQARHLARLCTSKLDVDKLISDPHYRLK